MKWFINIKIRNKFFILFGALLGILILFSIFYIIGIKNTAYIFTAVFCLLLILALFFTLKNIKEPVEMPETAVIENSTNDVPQEKQQEEKLREAIHAVEMALKAKSSFLANMSHEIRTPMNAIMGIAEILLQDKTHTTALREALSRIYSSGDLLLGIINDILDLSIIEAGKLELTPVQYDTASLINDTMTLNMMRGGSKPITFELSVDENIPAAMNGDVLRIKQILNNILSNAFKYTEKGLVKLSISAEPVESDEKNIMLVFNISDTGQGMTEEQVKKLFDEYSRFNFEANRLAEGTGLGMSITLNLIKLMNGNITIKSELNWGSVFTVRLPQEIVNTNVLGRAVVENLKNFKITGDKQLKRTQIVIDSMPYGRVLIVDDVESNLYVAKGLVAPYEIQIETVMSGFEAIDKIKADKIYDIIFMDHMMPKMDGMETAKIIRSLGYTHPIIALTANATVGQVEFFLANGFDGFISKPIDVRELNTALKKFVRNKHHFHTVDSELQQAPVKQQSLMEYDDKTSVLDEHPELADVFVNDITKVITIREEIQQMNYRNEDMQVYTINVHGLKSVLGNIGEDELRTTAEKLERAGRFMDMDTVTSGTPAFIDKLRDVIIKLSGVIFP